MRHAFEIVAIAMLASLRPALAAGPGDRFEEVVNLPACETTAPTVRIIRDQADWSDINNPAIRVFCVEPGDYRGLGVIRIQSSGTAATPRVLRYYDASAETDDTHPVHMAIGPGATAAGSARPASRSPSSGGRTRRAPCGSPRFLEQ